MASELNEKELEEIVGGLNDDGKRFNIECTKSSGMNNGKTITKNVKGTESKDAVLANRQKTGYTCTVIPLN